MVSLAVLQLPFRLRCSGSTKHGRAHQCNAQEQAKFLQRPLDLKPSTASLFPSREPRSETSHASIERQTVVAHATCAVNRAAYSLLLCIDYALRPVNHRLFASDARPPMLRKKPVPSLQ
eukprot:6189955-Pleurochrysis_carterae.AAC.12